MIRLEAHDWRADVDPQTGGSLSRLSYRDHPVFRERDPGASDFAPLQMSCFPLVPFSNRIGGGEFSFGGKTICLPLNMPGERHPIHGSGWTHEWDVTERSEHACSLEYRHEAGEWPWRFTATQEITLGPDGVVMALRLRNESTDVMPAGLGFHPYFHLTPDCQLAFAAQRVWTGPESGIPDRAGPVPAKWDFRKPRTVTGLDVDHCFSGWDGEARIAWPGAGLEIEMRCSDNARHAILYSPPHAPGEAGPGFFCLEPVTHVSNALNAASSEDAGIQALKPGATLSLVMALGATSRDPQAGL